MNFYDVEPSTMANLLTVFVAVWHKIGLSWKLDSLKKLSDEFTKFAFCPYIQKRHRIRFFLICVIFTVLSNSFSFYTLYFCEFLRIQISFIRKYRLWQWNSCFYSNFLPFQINFYFYFPILTYSYYFFILLYVAVLQICSIT